jgi:isocitrate dehydrogenase kinase/phosphatase
VQTGDARASKAAALLVAAFENYNVRFGEITRRARRRFEHRAWRENSRDAVERIELYESCVGAAVIDVKRLLGDDARDRDIWHRIRDDYAQRIRPFPDSEFYKTFFSSVTRRIFATIGVDPNVEFIALDVKPTADTIDLLERRVYRNRGNLRHLFDELLADYSFAVPYRDVERTIDYVTAEIEAYSDTHRQHSKVEQIEILDAVFYRSTRAYLVGKIDGNHWESPLVLALQNTDEGIAVDAVILSENDVSMLFGFTRSYFHADVGTVSAAVAFLKSIMPRKSIAEIYTVLGRAKQGKTERFRALMQHMQASEDLFTFARGDKGLVMEVFTLPSYPIVFKLIRDKFQYPKSIARRDVLEKYNLVFNHDRAGRLVDAQEFRLLEFDAARFEPELLEALLTGCSETCRIEGDQLVISHCYIERRLTPLNLYLQDAAPEDSRAAAIDYGQAIRDLAMSNIFAGDLLLKNFGVTRHGRVIFYDYDELCLVTECNFRRLPEARDDMDEMRSGAWFYVGPNDILPEQFVQFLGFREEAKKAFLLHHGDLLTAEYWIRLKKRLEAGETLEVIPYQPKRWSEQSGLGHYVSRQV